MDGQSTHDNLLCAEEFIADRATNFGYNRLELCYERPGNTVSIYSYHPGDSALASQLSKNPLPRGIPGLADAICGFLSVRGLSFIDDIHRDTWALQHHWPWTGTHILSSPDSSAIAIPAPEESPHHLIAEDGRYQIEFCFLLNQLIVVWEPTLGEFRFPVILDFVSAENARRRLSAGRIQLRGHPSTEPNSGFFEPLRTFARGASWPNLDALVHRSSQWDRWRTI
jgi:hypothetical protein